MSSAKKFQDKRILVEQLINEGATKKELSEKTEIPFGSINHYLKMWGLKTKKSWSESDTHKNEEFNSSFRGNIEGKDEVEQLLRQGKLLREISEQTGISIGSLSYKINSWGLKEIQKKFRPDSVVNNEKKQILAKAVSQPYKEDRPHWKAGLATVRGKWVSILELKEELEYFVAQDLTQVQMAELLGITVKPVRKYLNKFGLNKSWRSGERSQFWRGGHTRYRGSDWYSARQAALKRDNYICQICGITEAEYREKSGRGLSVHHIEPYYYDQQNLVDNLESLCQPCHIKLELAEGRFAGQMRTYNQIK